MISRKTSILTKFKRGVDGKRTYSPSIDLSTEVWKPVPSLPDFIASSAGRIASVIGHLNGNGYVTVYLPQAIPGLPMQSCGSSRGGYRTGVHQIIARTFLGEPKPGQTQVNHKDGDPTNNAVENIEWCTPSENLKHAYAHLGRRKAGPSKLKGEDRKKVRDMYKTGQYAWRDLALLFGVSYSTIGNAIREGKRAEP